MIYTNKKGRLPSLVLPPTHFPHHREVSLSQIYKDLRDIYSIVYVFDLVKL